MESAPRGSLGTKLAVCRGQLSNDSERLMKMILFAVMLGWLVSFALAQVSKARPVPIKSRIRRLTRNR